MKKENKDINIDRDISEIIQDIKGVIENNSSLLDSEINQEIVKLFDEAIQVNRNTKKLFRGFAYTILVFFAIMVSALIFSFVNNNELERIRESISQKDIIIEELKGSDSLFNKIMNVKYDSIEKSTQYTTLSINNKLQTYPDLVFRNDSLEELVTRLQEEVSIESNKISDYETKLSLVRSVYNISFSVKKTETKNTVNTTTKIIAPTIDSALFLLPYYRSKIKYDKNRGGWTIDK